MCTLITCIVWEDLKFFHKHYILPCMSNLCFQFLFSYLVLLHADFILLVVYFLLPNITIFLIFVLGY
jgi:hypothetical protein